MQRTDESYRNCIQVLHEELLPAMGCTEPIAIAYCAAQARKTLGSLPDRVIVEACGNIIKNVKSVVVPNTGHLTGIPAAAAAGIVYGKADKKLEVITEASSAELGALRDFLGHVPVEVRLSDTSLLFDLTVTVYKDASFAKVRIVNYHTNIVYIEKNGCVLLNEKVEAEEESRLTDRSFLRVELILEFADSVELYDVRDLLDRQISYNMAIAEEGLRSDYGANIGTVLLASNAETVKTKAMAYAAAASDARMNGCELPVIINSGSGNQGIAASVPVIVYARELGIDNDRMLRALVLSNLISIHQKTRIGRLSAYCGAVNAGAAAGCGIAYMLDGSLDAISHTLVNALAIVSGVVCDGAKASCAAKISTAVEAGIMGYEMYRNGQQFFAGTGIVKKGVENTIVSVGRLGHDGMRCTDAEILKIMLDDE